MNTLNALTLKEKEILAYMNAQSLQKIRLKHHKKNIMEKFSISELELKEILTMFEDKKLIEKKKRKYNVLEIALEVLSELV